MTFGILELPVPFASYYVHMCVLIAQHQPFPALNNWLRGSSLELSWETVSHSGIIDTQSFKSTQVDQAPCHITTKTWGVQADSPKVFLTQKTSISSYFLFNMSKHGWIIYSHFVPDYFTLEFGRKCKTGVSLQSSLWWFYLLEN